MDYVCPECGDELRQWDERHRCLGRKAAASDAQADGRRNTDLKREHREGLHLTLMPGCWPCFRHVPSADELNAQIKR